MNPPPLSGLLVALLLVPWTARAEALPAPSAPAAPNASVAEILFRDGQQLLAAGSTRQACLKFAESQRIDPQTGTLLNLALCHEREGRTATAWAELAQVVTQAVRKGEADREQFARSRGADVEKRLSRVTLDVARGITIVGVDGQALGEAAWEVPLPLDPGEHSFAFSAAGKKTAVLRAVVPPGPALVRIASPPLEDDPSTRGPSRPLLSKGALVRVGFAAGGVGIAGVAMGAVFGVMAIAKRDQVAAHCVGRECDVAGMGAQDTAHAFATASTAAFVAGAVGLGAGGYLVWLSSDARPGSGTAVRVGPVATSGGGLLRLEGGW